MTQLEPAGLPVPISISLTGHRLHVAVPLEVERLEAEPHRATAALSRFVIGRVPADGLDLPVAVTGVLLRVQLIRRRSAAGEAVMASELLVDARGGAVGSPVHRLDEREK